MQKPGKSLVAAIFEKAKTYIFAEPKIRNREVGASNPPGRDHLYKNLRLPTLAAVFVSADKI
jgi:hypothetical protein